MERAAKKRMSKTCNYCVFIYIDVKCWKKDERICNVVAMSVHGHGVLFFPPARDTMCLSEKKTLQKLG
jgi:hypothetical protein